MPQLLLTGVIPVLHVPEAPKLGNTFFYPGGFRNGNHLLHHSMFVLGDFLEVVDIQGHLLSQVGQIQLRVPGVFRWTNRLEGLRNLVTLGRSGGPWSP